MVCWKVSMCKVIWQNGADLDVLPERLTCKDYLNTFKLEVENSPYGVY